MSVVDLGRIQTTLVTERRTGVAYSGVRECDATVALRRGFAEYLAKHFHNPDVAQGRDVRPRVIVYDWVEWEKMAQWPAVYVGVAEETQYSARSLSNAPVATQIQLAGREYALFMGAEVVVNLMVEVWANDPRQRQMLVAGVEDALFPVDWMAGFRLALGHYHGAHAEYLPTTVRVDDSADDSVKRLRLATFNIEARVNLLRLTPRAAQARIGADVNLT